MSSAGRDTLLAAIVLGIVLISPSHLSACQPVDSEDPGLKVGLVLSGGGAKGIAHVGVIRAIEEAGIRIDYITGTSMGSIVGAFYAIGYTPDEMEEIAESTDWDALFSDSPGRRRLSMFEKEVDEHFIASFPVTERGINLPAGVVAGQNILSWLNRYTWPVHNIEDFSEFPIPFATVATDLETGEAVVFKSGYLPDAIRASISLPTFLMPYQLNGKTLVDGGLVRNLPVEDVIDMGADYVIAVDVTNPLRDTNELSSILTILNQAVYFRATENLNEQKELADLVIEINEMENYNLMDFDQAALFIRAGENAARNRMEELQKIAALQNPVNKVPVPIPDRSSFLIEEISVEGNRDVPETLILSELDIKTGDTATPESIEESIERLYSTRLFNLVTYKLTPLEENRFILTFRVIENLNDTFRVGVRYENETHASVRLHSAFRNLLHRGSNLRFDIRLGRDIELQSEYLYFGGNRSRYGLRTTFGYMGEQINYYEGNERISNFTNHIIRADLFTGTFLNHNYLFGFGFRKDFIHFTDEINSEAIPFTSRDYHAVYGLLWLDSLNRRSYPTRGQKLLIRGTLSDSFLFSPISFNEQRFYWKAWYPLSDDVSIQHTIFAGRTSGRELPWQYWFTPNRYHDLIGFTRFGGYNRYELTGRNIQMASAGLRLEIARHRFIRIDGYIGKTMSNWSWDLSGGNWRTGYSLTAGLLTILGPVEAIFSTSSQNPLIFELQAGYEF